MTSKVDEYISNRIKDYDYRPTTYCAGTVTSAADGIAHIDGISGCRYNEILEFGENAFGIAMNIDIDSVGAVMLTGQDEVYSGMTVKGTDHVVEVPVGEAVIGRIINPIGQPIDELGPISSNKTRPIESPAPSIIDRQSVCQPLQTGIIAIDAIVPIGKGQRELIIGDRQTGKTAIAVDAILNQKGKNIRCVYCAIGQKASTVAQVVNTLKQHGAMEYTTVVVSTASESSAMQYIAPYAGCAIAEHFMYEGKDALIVYDDLSKHAVAYRTMSLLLRRPPGREAYPGDVFYLHSRLLERAAKLSDEGGGGSLTALPIVEAVAGDISGYIPTNVISITDGQIYLESELFNSGIRPAVNTGLSVSRVGGSAQIKAMRKVASRLRLDLSQYRELAVFAQFSSDLDNTTREMLSQGERLTEMLKQDQYKPLSVAQQVILLYAINRGFLKELTASDIKPFKKEFLEYIGKKHSNILSSIEEQGELTDSIDEILTLAVTSFMEERAKRIEAEKPRQSAEKEEE